MRSGDLDTQVVRSAICRYRGITGSFDELTRAYALSTYADAELLGWEAGPNPVSPETEALVTARFRVAGVRPDSSGLSPSLLGLRRRVGDALEVTWKLNDLAAEPVTAHDDYARDALDVYRQTVDRLLDRMVYLAEATPLYRTPAGVAADSRLDPGTVLMREPATAGETAGWVRVRVPSDTTSGWVQAERLRPVYGDRP